MARELNKRKAEVAIALIVDGEDEKWYINKVKEHYPCEAVKSIKVKPELPERKKVQELFDFAKNKLDKGFSFVILVFDFDGPLKDHREMVKFKELYLKYLAAQNNTLTGRQKSLYGWMKDMLCIVNNPCLEYWYLLHYRKTTRFYLDFAALRPDLSKIPEFAQYDKSEEYYNCHPDIYERLAKNNGLEKARRNAVRFDINNCTNHGGSEMNLIFDYFDTL